MEIQSANTPAANSTKSSPKKVSKDDIEAKLREKFGDKFQSAKKKNKALKQEDTKVTLSKKGDKFQVEDGFGDIKNNDPKSEVTQEKLKTILKKGGFDFNSKERSALEQILK